MECAGLILASGQSRTMDSYSFHMFLVTTFVRVYIVYFLFARTTRTAIPETNILSAYTDEEIRPWSGSRMTFISENIFEEFVSRRSNEWTYLQWQSPVREAVHLPVTVGRSCSKRNSTLTQWINWMRGVTACMKQWMARRDRTYVVPAN